MGIVVPPLLLAVKLPMLKWATAARMPCNRAAVIQCLLAAQGCVKARLFDYNSNRYQTSNEAILFLLCENNLR